MKKRNSLFLAGMLTGIIGTSAVFLAVQFKAEKNVPERPAVAPAPYAAEFFPRSIPGRNAENGSAMWNI
ncbi:MAG: hypothetical protein IKD44_07410 [Lentisphaeria bacterium]|nr:hypothetical protein [Lentisphaeria bacterium]